MRAQIIVMLNPESNDRKAVHADLTLLELRRRPGTKKIHPVNNAYSWLAQTKIAYNDEACNQLSRNSG